MSNPITLSNDVAEHLKNLELGESDNIDEKVRMLLVAEYRRRLTRYHLTDQQLTQKYGMSFELFERQQITKKRSYSWEVESDAIAWETAVDGIRTVKKQLSQLEGNSQ